MEQGTFSGIQNSPSGYLEIRTVVNQSPSESRSVDSKRIPGLGHGFAHSACSASNSNWPPC